MRSMAINCSTASTVELIAALREIAAELAGRDAPESGAESMALAEEMVAGSDQWEAALSHLVRRVETTGEARSAGYTSTQNWLSSACGMRVGPAHDRAVTAQQMPRLEDVAKRFVAGGLPFGYVTTIADAAARLDDDDAPIAERLMLERVDDGWTTQEVAQYAGRIHDHVRIRNGEELKPEDARRGYKRSWIRLSRSTDGGAYLKGWLNPENATLWRACLEPLAKPAGADDPRDHAERLADAAQLIFSGNGTNWGATIILDYETLVANERRPGKVGDPADVGGRAGPESGAARPRRGVWFPDGTPVAPERARQIALNAGISALILGSDGLPLYLGRTVRLVSAGQRRALEVVYRSCAVVDCGIPATSCEIDHVTPWSEGGRTDIDRLAPLCGYHNRYKARHPNRITAEWSGKRWRYTIRRLRSRPPPGADTGARF